jgi:hypothetical protein
VAVPLPGVMADEVKTLLDHATSERMTYWRVYALEKQSVNSGYHLATTDLISCERL